MASRKTLSTYSLDRSHHTISDMCYYSNRHKLSTLHSHDTRSYKRNIRNESDFAYKFYDWTMDTFRTLTSMNVKFTYLYKQLSEYNQYNRNKKDFYKKGIKYIVENLNGWEGL